MERLKIYIPFFLIYALLLTGCSSTQTLSDNEILLAKNSLEVKGNAKIDTDEASGYIQQKSNKTILGFLKFHLFLFNLVPDSYVEKRNIACDDRVDRKNDKRVKKNAKALEKGLEKGKDSTDIKMKPLVDCHPSFWDNLRNTIGESPIVFDSSKVEDTKIQLNKYLKSKGYFHGVVENEIRYKNKRSPIDGFKRKKKAFVKYILTPNDPFVIKKVTFSINDTALLDPIRKGVNGTLLKPGNNYDVDIIDDERKRLTKSMRDKGYYFFNKDYIVYEIDTTVGDNKIIVKQIIQNPLDKGFTSTGKDTLYESVHSKYRISKVVVNANFDPKNQSLKMEEDRIEIDNISFINKSFLLYYPDVIANQIFIRPGQLFSESKDDYTYKRLSGLNNFKFIDISYREDESSEGHNLVCYINLTPSVKQSLGLEAEGTTTGGQLGLSGNLNYKNRNTFGRAEQLDIRGVVGVEAQQTINGNTDDDEESALESFTPFNTIEYGGVASITFPKLLLFEKLFFKNYKYNNPKTPINLSYNFQQRPEYTRTAVNSSIALNFQGVTKNPKDFKITPIQLSVIGITKTDDFQEYLDELNNSFLSNTYENHFILSTKFDYVWTNKTINHNRNFSSFIGSLELAGPNSYLYPFFQISQSVTEDGESYKQMFDIRYAEFAKVSGDVRHTETLSSKDKLVYRVYAGLGIPYGNLNVLPFNRSFFGGGANDIRAWAARRLGPGGITYLKSSQIDQLGDIILEGNLEYRFNFTPIFGSALFVDAGNVWLINTDEDRPNGDFDPNRFYKEIAIGSGIGFRFDFTFILIRMDVAFKIKDPGLIEDERWIFQPKDQYELENGSTYKRFSPTFNLGIGYPF